MYCTSMLQYLLSIILSKDIKYHIKQVQQMKQDERIA